MTGAALLVPLLLAAMVSCDDGPQTAAVPSDNDPEVGVEPEGVSFFFDPARFIGEAITVTGYVSEVLNPFAFRIAGDRIEGRGVLVVSDDGVELEDDDLVQITGTVRWFTVDRFVEDLDVRLDPVVFHAFEGEVAVAAQQVTVNGIMPSPQP